MQIEGFKPEFTGSKFEINAFPMPISVNHAFDGIVKKFNTGRYKMGRVKSKAYAAYSRECGNWALENRKEVMAARKGMMALGKNQMLTAEITFNFRYSSVFCVSKKLFRKPKKMDISNRIKVLEDELCKLFAFDDCQIMGLGVTKGVSILTDDQPETVDITLKGIDVEYIHELHKNLIK